jgi:hypothetical protein
LGRKAGVRSIAPTPRIDKRITVVQVWAELDEAGAQFGQLGDELAVLFLDDAHAVQRFIT